MKESEIIQIILAVITLSVVIGFTDLISLNAENFGKIALVGAIIILVNIFAKKLMASHLDADVEHEIWKMQRYGLKEGDYLKKSIPAGIIFPIFITAITLGTVNLITILTYETRALKRRAAKRFGPFSFTEMTDYHNALVGAAGILSSLAVAFISYWIPGAGLLGKIATFYAFSNMIPVSKLDGAQIYFGSRVLWATLAIITLIFTAYALLLV
ncbi:MAG: hypothetical protein AABY16_02205 [Nanoarchaeota archaeon]